MAKRIEINALHLYNIEQYLELNEANLAAGKPMETEPFDIIPGRKVKNLQKERFRLAEKYGLTKVRKSAPYSADEDEVYEKICSYYPCARTFGSFRKISLAMNYGNAPCKTYTIEDIKNEESKAQ